MAVPSKTGWVLAGCELCTLHQVKIEIPVVIVVEQGPARSRNLGQKILSRCAVEMHEVDSGFFGGVPEQNRWRREAGWFVHKFRWYPMSVLHGG